jgi:hypothetical protein
VHVLGSTGHFFAPPDSILKVGSGTRFFYSDGAFSVQVPGGQTDIVVERGTEYQPLRMQVDVPDGTTLDLDLPLKRWIRLPEMGWRAGNTHIHYDETEQAPADRLSLDPLVEDLPVTIVSVLKRRDLAYASNAFPIGRHSLSRPGHVIDVGEETRHNDEPWHIGLGHVMLINIKSAVEPISRGILVDDSSADYPPLVDACDEAHRQGALTLWCHNGNGMEAPIAAGLGRLDGLNLFDPYWMTPEYNIWYRLLNCGIRLPASTGSDWFICSSNRVYVDVGADFSYDRWLDRLRSGRSFITNGPALRLTVADHPPSNELLELRAETPTVPVIVNWDAVQPIDQVELIRDGEVVAAIDNRDRATRGRFEVNVDVSDAGWIAARCSGRSRNSYDHPLWAHTSPVYLRKTADRPHLRSASTFFLERIDLARNWIATQARFETRAQRERMLQLFTEGRNMFESLSRA